MTNLYDTYNVIKEFAETHNMINEFIYVRSEEEMRDLEFNYRSMICMPLEANISRELNNPIYTLDFGIVILDKISKSSDFESVVSIEENIFIIGQLQDYLIQAGMDTDFESVDLYTAVGDDYNITSATADFSVNIARKPYTRTINNI
jgi:hypothetical protein